MKEKTRYDLIVIGGGSAGHAPAVKCAQAGWSVAVIESQPFGGTCALRGCQPKKILASASEVVERYRMMEGRGLAGGCSIDWPSLIAFKTSFTDPVPEDKEGSLKKAGVDTIHGRAVFTGRNTVSIGGTELEGGKFVIATGAMPRLLDIEGAEHVLSSDDFLEMPAMPKSLVFIGGGFISFEFGHIAASAGAEVTILEMFDRSLGMFDPDLVDMMTASAAEKGIRLLTRMPVKSIRRDGDEVVVRAGEGDGMEFRAGAAVHGAGRVPAVSGIGLDTASAEHDDNGVKVNEYLQSVSNPDVYAAGDVVAGGIQLLPFAIMHGDVVAHNLLNGNEKTPDYGIVPKVVFTHPPLASVGISEKEARYRELSFETRFNDTSRWATSRRVGLKRSGVKVLVEKDTDRILGAHVYGYHAEEIINVFALAIAGGITSSTLMGLPWAYPTGASDIDMLLE